MRKTNTPARSPLKATQWHKSGLVVPKDDDGAYRVHGRLDGSIITNLETQAKLKLRPAS